MYTERYACMEYWNYINTAKWIYPGLLWNLLIDHHFPIMMRDDFNKFLSNQQNIDIKKKLT